MTTFMGSSESGEFWTYANAVAIPPEIKVPLLKTFHKWLVCSGAEWTVMRIKTLYTDFIRHSAGEEMVGTWVRRHPDGLPAGPVGALYRFAAKGEKQMFHAITLLRAYTRLVSSEPTPKQMEKFVTGVTSAKTAIPESLTEGVIKQAQSLGVRLCLKPAPPYWTYSPSDKRVPGLDGKTHSELDCWATQWMDIKLSYYGCTARMKHRVIFNDVLGDFVEAYRAVGPSPRRIDCVGSIGFIQEPGFKLRAVANPNRVYQMALKPLGDALFGLLKDLPWDCTHDQRKALPFIQDALFRDDVVHCVDLASATDYFPLDLQISALRTLTMSGERDYVSLFEDISRAPWRMGKTVISWSRGQPLGLYPSFASFALTHGLLLLHLNDGRHDNAFFVLGDDVVILNNILFIKYVKALKDLGCPTSDAKSLNSSSIAEFAGKIITKAAVFPQPKWRDLSDDNFLDIVRLLGERALLLCRPRQRKVAKAMWEIPEFVGGLGFNPHGRPLSDRYFEYLKIFEPEDRGEYLMSFDRRLSKFLYPEKTASGFLTEPWLKNRDRGWIPALDQRALALVLEYFPTLNVNGVWKFLGTNLYDIVPVKGVLPQVGGEGRQTLLSLLWQKLGL